MSVTDNIRADRPLIEGLLSVDGDQVSLLGSHCVTCDTRYFPAVQGCRDPDCPDSDIEPCTLPRTGSLFSYTWQSYQPPAPFVMDDWKPYAIGMVDLGDGLRILSRLDVEREDLRIGMPLTVAADVMRTEGSRAEICYIFRQPEHV